MFSLLGLLCAAHSLLEAEKIGVLDELFVADNLVNGLDDVECLHLLRSSEFVLSLTIFRSFVFLIVQADVLPFHKTIEPSDFDLLLLVFTCAVI